MVLWAIHCRGIHHLLHYLDDFLLFRHPGTSEPGQAVATALEVFVEARLNARLSVPQHQLLS